MTTGERFVLATVKIVTDGKYCCGFAHPVVCPWFTSAHDRCGLFNERIRRTYETDDGELHRCPSCLAADDAAKGAE